MAIQSSFNKFGITFPDAYFRINNVITNKQTIRIDVFVFVNQTVVNDEPLQFLTFDFEFVTDLPGANPLEQAYNLLKTVPTFESAQDV
jgi:hypothetical protein